MKNYYGYTDGIIVFVGTDENGFLYLVQSNSYFRINLNSVRNSEHQIRNWNENGFDIFLTVFYFSTF